MKSQSEWLEVVLPADGGIYGRFLSEDSGEISTKLHFRRFPSGEALSRSKMCTIWERTWDFWADPRQAAVRCELGSEIVSYDD